jgi:hypothetical protein
VRPPEFSGVRNSQEPLTERIQDGSAARQGRASTRRLPSRALSASGLPPLHTDRLVNAEAGTEFPAALFLPIPTGLSLSEASVTPSSVENSWISKGAACIMPDKDMVEPFVRTIKRDYVRVSKCPDAETVMSSFLRRWPTTARCNRTRCSASDHVASSSRPNPTHDPVLLFGGNNRFRDRFYSVLVAAR